MSGRSDGRRFQPELTAMVAEGEGGTFELRAPGVGAWRGAPHVGAVITGGSIIGELEVLGVRHLVRVPPSAHGVVVGEPPARGLARRPVAYGEALLRLDPSATGAALGAGSTAEAAALSQAGALVFRSPSSGRFYGRPSPDRPPFVVAGQELDVGATVCLLEVMKTFNRVSYGGDELPRRARVVRVIPADESDLDAGDPILELEAL